MRMGRERDRDAETNQWHMIVCIYCRRDSCRSHVEHTIVCDSRCVYVFQLWDVRSKIVVAVVVVVVASLCIRLCRCWSLDIIWRHIILCYFGVSISVSLYMLCMWLWAKAIAVAIYTPLCHLFHTVIVHKPNALCARQTLPDIRIGCYSHITHFILNKYCFLSWVFRSQPVLVDRFIYIHRLYCRLAILR